MRYALIVLLILLCSVSNAVASVSVSIGLPSVSIGINVPVYPTLVLVPGYPVYYAPSLGVNLFFYDGLFWVYEGDTWYVSTWYNGPWQVVAPEVIPVFILRVPVRFYVHPPVYFRAWVADAPPRWGEHWGRGWEQRRAGWDKWNRGSAPAPAPLPVYQKQYSGERYPRPERQAALQSQNYRYQPRDPVARQQYQQARAQASPVPARRSEPQGEARPKGAKPQAIERSTPPPPQRGPSGPRSEPFQGSEGARRRAPAPPQGGPAVQPQQQPDQPRPAQHEERGPRPSGHERGPQGKGAPQGPQGPKQDKEQGPGPAHEKEQGHNR